MTDKLPPNLLALFAPRPALRYMPPSDFPVEERKTHRIDPVAPFLHALKQDPGNHKPTESWLEKHDRKQLATKEAAAHTVGPGFEQGYKPNDDPNIRGDAFKTLFISRLAYATDEKDLAKVFEKFGPIERCHLVRKKDPQTGKKGKSRGYAFVVFEREKDMKAAYKETDGIKIRDRTILVDVERGRTVSGWRPRRYGGGLGGRGYTKPAKGAAAPAPAPAGPAGFAPRGGYGGAFRGGFSDRGGGFRGRGAFNDNPRPYGGDRGPRGGYGGRGGVGYGGGGAFGAPPEGAPAGPRGASNRGGFTDRGANGRPPYNDGPNNGYSTAGSGERGFDGRRIKEEPGLRPNNGYSTAGSGERGFDGRRIKEEPGLHPDGGRGSYRDRDRDGGGGGGYDRKRPFEGSGGQDESRQRRRY